MNAVYTSEVEPGLDEASKASGVQKLRKPSPETCHGVVERRAVGVSNRDSILIPGQKAECRPQSRWLSRCGGRRSGLSVLMTVLSEIKGQDH